MEMDSSSGRELGNKERVGVRILSSQSHLERAKRIVCIGGVRRIPSKGESNHERASIFFNSRKHAPHTYLFCPSNIIESPSSVYNTPFSGTVYAYFLARLFFNFGDF